VLGAQSSNVGVLRSTGASSAPDASVADLCGADLAGADISAADRAIGDFCAADRVVGNVSAADRAIGDVRTAERLVDHVAPVNRVGRLFRRLDGVLLDLSRADAVAAQVNRRVTDTAERNEQGKSRHHVGVAEPLPDHLDL